MGTPGETQAATIPERSPVRKVRASPKPCLPAPYNLAPPDPVFTLPDPHRRKSSIVPRGGGKMIPTSLQKGAKVFDNRVSRRLRHRSGRQEGSAEAGSARAIPEQRHTIPVHDVFSPLVQGLSPCHPRRSEAKIALVIPDEAKRRSLLSSPTERSGDRPCHPRRSEAEIGDGR